MDEGQKQPIHHRQYHWCRSCKCSHPQSINTHNHTPKHQQILLDFLEKEYEKIKACRFFLHQPAKVTDPLSQKNYNCFCCEEEIDNSKNEFVCFNTLKHLQRNSHRKKVDEFWNDTAAYLLKQKLKKKCKSKYCVSQVDYRKFLKQITRFREPEEEKPPVTEEHIYSLQQKPIVKPLSSPNQISPSPQPVAPGAFKTVVSSNGILQNPTGIHEGQRVWGGGIVKYKKEGEWIPWPIDLDEDNQIGQQTLEAPLMPPMTLSESARRIPHPLQQTLTSIQVPEGDNIHTGATPPWLLDSNGKVRNLPRRRIALPKPKKKNPKERPQKLGADLVRPKTISASFLPNFGGVWETGSRAESQRKFRENAVMEGDDFKPSELATIDAQEINFDKMGQIARGFTMENVFK